MGGHAEKIDDAPESRRRSIYGFIDRQNLPGLFRTFDFASPDTSNPGRFTTNVPQQALFLMNSPFIVEQAKNLAQRLKSDSEGSPEAEIKQLYRILYQRDPKSEELKSALEYLEMERRQNPEDLSGDSNRSSLSPLVRLTQALMVSNELFFVD
jgi:hypothetical protein